MTASDLAFEFVTAAAIAVLVGGKACARHELAAAQFLAARPGPALVLVLPTEQIHRLHALRAQAARWN